jgi:hypothetical protein
MAPQAETAKLNAACAEQLTRNRIKADMVLEGIIFLNR